MRHASRVRYGNFREHILASLVPVCFHSDRMGTDIPEALPSGQYRQAGDCHGVDALKSFIRWAIATGVASLMFTWAGASAQVAMPGHDIGPTGNWPKFTISESRYRTLVCREDQRLYRHPTRVDKVVCVRFSVSPQAIDCDGGRSGKEIIVQRGADYCIGNGARLHVPVCPPRLGTGGNAVQKGQDLCGLKGSTTRPRCEPNHIYRIDARGNEDACLPRKFDFVCDSGFRAWRDSDRFRDQCGKFVYSEPTVS